MEKLLIFGALSIPIVALSWHTLFAVKSHGFYGFFAWECILWLSVSNIAFWFQNAFSIRQIISWIFLFFATYLVIAGAVQLRKAGKADINRDAKALYHFEKTTKLVDNGIFGYIRHPLYSSLIFLTWGILLKHITMPLLLIAVASTIFLFFTSFFDEKECIKYFGDKYKNYMTKTKRFVPFLF